jgi:nucleotide-binding universal stress UspA family protein
MFKHILLPTDGSELSMAATKKGIQLAKSINAKVTGFHVTPTFHVLTLNLKMLESTKEQFEKDCKAEAENYLALVAQAAADAGVPCDIDYVANDHPDEAIVKAAEEKGCDLIAMGSHGASGLRSVLIGSVTQKVLAKTQLPVLVFR